MRVFILLAALSLAGCSTIREWIGTLPTPRPEPTASPTAVVTTPVPSPTARPSTPLPSPTVRPPTPIPQPTVPPSTEIEWRNPRDGNGGFLWKPQADNTPKNLVVLIPSSFNGITRSVELYRAQPPSSTTLIERGRYTGIANANRGHWRYSRPGGDYGTNVIVLVTRDNGSRVGYVIPDGADRVD